MIDDNFNDPVFAYLKGKAMQEKKQPSVGTENKHVQSELADYARDVAQLRQERDALRLRIKAVDEEHVQLGEERKKMIDAYTKLEEEQKREREAFREEMGNGFKDLQRVEKERDQYKKLWTIRGKALEQPCLLCGYTGNQIRMQNGEIP